MLVPLPLSVPPRAAAHSAPHTPWRHVKWDWCRQTCLFVPAAVSWWGMGGPRGFDQIQDQQYQLKLQASWGSFTSVLGFVCPSFLFPAILKMIPRFNIDIKDCMGATTISIPFVSPFMKRLVLNWRSFSKMCLPPAPACPWQLKTPHCEEFYFYKSNDQIPPSLSLSNNSQDEVLPCPCCCLRRFGQCFRPGICWGEFMSRWFLMLLIGRDPI